MKGGVWISAWDGRESFGELAGVSRNQRHTIASDYRSAICLVIEPESVPDGTIDEVSKRLSGPERELIARRIRAAYDELLHRRCRDDIGSAEFDRMCFGEALPRRRLDPRVARAIAQIERFSEP